MNLVQLFGLSLLFCLAVLAALTLRFAVPQPPHPLLLLALAVLQTCSVIAKEALLRRRAARHAAPAPRRTLAHRSRRGSHAKARRWVVSHASPATRVAYRA